MKLLFMYFSYNFHSFGYSIFLNFLYSASSICDLIGANLRRLALPNYDYFTSYSIVYILEVAMFSGLYLQQQGVKMTGFNFFHWFDIYLYQHFQ
jgi:hypothetical protein